MLPFHDRQPRGSNVLLAHSSVRELTGSYELMGRLHLHVTASDPHARAVLRVGLPDKSKFCLMMGTFRESQVESILLNSGLKKVSCGDLRLQESISLACCKFIPS